VQIFISYRRDDTQHAAGRLASALSTEFGAESVFLDVRSIQPGSRFAQDIDRAGATADVLIALIGERWLSSSDASGNRRLDDPSDFVRREIATALEQDLQVVPTLVDGAAMPSPDQLPAEIRELAMRNAFELSHSRWDSDVARLVEALDTSHRADRPSLPVPATRLVGRDQELAELIGLLGRLDIRLVTLTGAPGTGKTRLAIEVGTRTTRDLDLPAFFVDLASIDDPAIVTSAIATAVGVRDTGQEPLLELVSDALRERKLLLILDNFEHVRSASPEVARLIEVAPEARIIATSRAALRVRGEHEYEVAPLDVGGVDAADAAESPAVTLFVDRAQAVDPQFQLTAGNAAAVTAVCAQLDGLPLAIELAAARIKVLPPAAILSRLSHRLDFLTGGARDLPLRQQTLRATLEWSYSLLAAPEQALLARLAVFSGGATLENAEEVCGPGLGADVFDALATLVDDSLVARTTSTSEGARFRMLKTVREFATDELDRFGDSTEIRRRHAEHFVQFAEQRAAEIRGQDQVAALDRLEEEHDNLRAALAWLQEHDLTLAQELATSLWLFWGSRGHVTEAAAQLGRLLAATTGQRTKARGRVLVAAGWIADMSHGDNQVVREAFDESVSIARELGDDATLASALGGLAEAAWRQGDSALAEALWRQSLDIYRELGDDWGAAHVLSALLMLDDTALEETLELVHRMGDKRREASVLGNAGYGALARGDAIRARELTERAMEMSHAVGDTDATLTINLAYAFVSASELARAEDLFRDAIVAATRADSRLNVVYCLVGMAAIAVERGDARRGATLLGAADSLRPSGVRLEPVERESYESTLRAVTAGLGEEECAVAFAEGAAMTLPGAVGYVVAEAGTS
jgi:predicted ATPase